MRGVVWVLRLSSVRLSVLIIGSPYDTAVPSSDSPFNTTSGSWCPAAIVWSQCLRNPELASSLAYMLLEYKSRNIIRSRTIDCRLSHIRRLISQMYRLSRLGEVVGSFGTNQGFGGPIYRNVVVMPVRAGRFRDLQLAPRSTASSKTQQQLDSVHLS